MPAPQNAFMRFCVDERDKIRKELLEKFPKYAAQNKGGIIKIPMIDKTTNKPITKYGKPVFHTVAQELAKRWKEMPDDQKGKLKNEAVADRKKYVGLKELLTKKNDEIRDIINELKECASDRYKEKHYMEIFNDFVGYKCVKCEEIEEKNSKLVIISEKIKSIKENLEEIKFVLDV
jgi:hypothetical protein